MKTTPQRRLGQYIVLGLLLLTILSTTLVARAQTTPVEIMGVGDSINAGGFSALQGRVAQGGHNVSYVGYAYDFGEFKSQNEGGWECRQMLGQEYAAEGGIAPPSWESPSAKTAVQAAGDFQPNIIYIMCGANDGLHGKSVDGTLTALRAMITHIYERSPTSKIVLASSTYLSSIPNWVNQYNSAIPGIVNDFAAQGRTISFLDMYPVVPASMLPDGIHPNSEGYTRMADAWYNAMLPYLNATTPTATATPVGSATYEAEAAGNTRSGSATVGSCTPCSGGQRVQNVGNGGGGNGTLQFNGVSASSAGSRQVTISYLNGDSAARSAQLSVNGGAATTISFPSTGSWPNPNVGTLNINVNLNAGSNTLRFSNGSTWAPDFDRISVLGSNTVTATPTATPTGSSTTVNDNTTGTGANQFNYSSGWGYATSCGSICYQGDDHYSTTTNATVTFAFTGPQVEIYGIKANNIGISAISIDNGAETLVDGYQATKVSGLLGSYTGLSNTSHTLKVRVTGTKNASSLGTYVSIDKVVFVSNSAATATPSSVPTATPTATPVPISFVKGINFNGNAVTIEGNLWLAYSAALSSGLSVGTAATFTSNLTPTPAVDTDTRAMLDSSVYRSAANLNLSQTISNGSYQIYLWVFENYQSNFRSFHVNIEGSQKAAGIGQLALNSWQKYGPYSVTVADGTLNIDLIRVSGDPVISGLAIFSGPAATATPTATPTTAPPTSTPASGTGFGLLPNGLRDKYKWPFATNSIWNTPIGSGAVYLPARIGAALERGMTHDDDVIVMSPGAPLTDVYKNNVGWSSGSAGARCPAQGSLITRVPIPANFVVPHEGGTPNMAAGVLLADGRTIHQSQPMHRCTAGSYATSLYPYPSSDIYSDGIEGAHGGSGMSSVGGTIRAGELVPGGVIRHALKMNLFGKKYIAYRNDSTPGYRWPAVKADSYAASNYGGSVPDLEMGALLALKPDFTISTLQTEPARIIARALMDYGGYIVDDTFWDVYAIETAWEPDGRVISQFQSTWGFSYAMADLNHPWSRDMATIFTNLQVVTNNGPSSIGGGGTPRVPRAPAIGN